MSRIALPPDAPFTGPQKMWLKGFLDGLSTAFPQAASGAAAPIAPAPSVGVPVTILWGSQTGNSEALGKRLTRALSGKGHSVQLLDMAAVAARDLAGAEHVLIITSTYGDGEPPDNAAELHAALAAADAPALSTVHFAVLALGDSNYPDFCQCGRDFDTRLAALGARRLLPIVEVDVDYDAPFASWSKELERKLGSLAAA